MNSASKDIAKIINGISSLGLALGTDLFYGRMNQEPDRVVVIQDNVGSPARQALLKSESDYYNSSVSIYVRDTKYEDAFVLAKAVHDYLHMQHGDVIDGTYYAVIRALNEPQLLHYEERNDRPVFLMTFEVQRRNN